MKLTALIFAVLLLAAPTKTTIELPDAIRNYASWKQITLDGYSIPGHLARLCVAAAHPDEVVEESSNVFVRVFANPVALNALFSKDPFSEGSILVKEKRGFGQEKIHQGVMIKRSKGWEFSYYPYEKGSSFRECATCHNSAPHDSVFAPYLKKK